MSTEAQIAANRANAQASTGPKSDEGKANSSRNGIASGLYTAGDFVRPGEESDYDALDETLRSELAPYGFLESTIVDDIRRALWRLRRCGNIEGKLANPEGELTEDTEALDPMETNSRAAKIQLSVDRARAQSQRQFHKGMTELRKLQTERTYRNEYFKPEYDYSHLGVADFRSVMKGIAEHCSLELRKRKIGGLDTMMSIVNIATKREPADSVSANAAPANRTQSEPEAEQAPEPAPEPAATKQTQSQPEATPRNAKCPCGSGQKHKRCCGKDAPPLLFAA